jgi:hypothetical protein
MTHFSQRLICVVPGHPLCPPRGDHRSISLAKCVPGGSLRNCEEKDHIMENCLIKSYVESSHTVRTAFGIAAPAVQLIHMYTCAGRCQGSAGADAGPTQGMCPHMRTFKTFVDTNAVIFLRTVVRPTMFTAMHTLGDLCDWLIATGWTLSHSSCRQTLLYSTSDPTPMNDPCHRLQTCSVFQ